VYANQHRKLENVLRMEMPGWTHEGSPISHTNSASFVHMYRDNKDPVIYIYNEPLIKGVRWSEIMDV
jgi:hypothetical protein